MLYSMTGFSSQTITICSDNGECSQVTLSLKSLNSRFFESSCKMAYALSHLETAITKKLKQKLVRGTVFFTMYMDNPGALQKTVVANASYVEGYIKAIQGIEKKYELGGELTLNQLIMLPHVFDSTDESISSSVVEKIMAAIDILIEELLSERKIEGEVLSKDIRSRLLAMQKGLDLIEPRTLEIIEQKRTIILDNFKALVVSLGQEQALDNCSSIFNQLERMDIHEEIIRFKSHIDNIYSVLDSEGLEKGKKLDFILQELFREINTMMAKCSDASIARLGINIKVELEKAREQIQNIV